jgi:acyl carrier protein
MKPAEPGKGETAANSRPTDPIVDRNDLSGYPLLPIALMRKHYVISKNKWRMNHMTFEKVAKILADYKEIDVTTITPDTNLRDLELDSLDMVELIMSMEEEFGHPIEMEEELHQVKDIVKLIDEGK